MCCMHGLGWGQRHTWCFCNHTQTHTHTDKSNLWVLEVITWVLRAGWWEQISCDLGRRLTAAWFTLYFINPKHTLYPSVTPPPTTQASYTDTHTLKGAPNISPWNLFGWSICHQKWHRSRTSQRQTNTKSHGGLFAISVRKKQRESQRCPNKALIVPRAQRENSVNP